MRHASVQRENAMMTPFQWACICSIHQEPNYQFNGTERLAAEAMVKRGWLRRKGAKHTYTVTKAGERAYTLAGGGQAPRKLPPRLVTDMLGLPENARLQVLVPSRVEYGYKDEVCVCFEIEGRAGYFHAVREEQFAAHKGKRQVGIFAQDNPIVALAALLRRYPGAVFIVRKDPKGAFSTR
jgi:hypothetical protein